MEMALNPLRRSSILDAKYEVVDTAEGAEQQKHLSQTQRNDLAALLHRFPRLFDGILRSYPHHKVHLELIPNARPIHQRLYSVRRPTWKHSNMNWNLSVALAFLNIVVLLSRRRRPLSFLRRMVKCIGSLILGNSTK